jgi:hypothetical protein
MIRWSETILIKIAAIGNCVAIILASLLIFLTVSRGAGAANLVIPDAVEHVFVDPEVLVPGSSATVSYGSNENGGHPHFIHYGFNGWNLPTNGEGAGEGIDLENRNFYMHVPMTYDSVKKRYVVKVAIPSGARALHMDFCWDDCRGGKWDNNGGQDFAWPVVYPYIGPILTWNEKTQPASGVVISFETGYATEAWLEYGKQGQVPTRLASAKGIAHRFVLNRLASDTDYRYRVGSGLKMKSASYTFKTAKPSAGLENLSFLVFGDVQDNGEDGKFAKLVDEIVANQNNFDFILSTGDLPWNDRPGDWWTFFDKGRALFGNHVIMPAIGNHDTPTVNSNSNHSSFVRYFALPGITEEKVFYQFTFGSAEFFAMNSERPDEMVQVHGLAELGSDAQAAGLAASGLQYSWLKNQLDTRNLQSPSLADTRWNFAYWHIPPFNAGMRHGSQQGQSRAVAGLFDGIVDWHFGGHEHLYQRTKPLREADRQVKIMPEYGTGPNNGVGYLIVPAGGVSPAVDLVATSAQRDSRERLAFPVVGASVNTVPGVIGYTRVDITGAAIDLRVFSIPEQGGAATVIDRTRYRKP